MELFPSDTKIRELWNTSASYRREAELSVKETLLQSSGTEKKMVSVKVFQAENLLAYIEAVFSKFCEKHSFYVENIDEAVFLVFGGDKGGTSTKLNFSIVASGTTSSANNAKIFAKYEVADADDPSERFCIPFLVPLKIWNNQSFA